MCKCVCGSFWIWIELGKEGVFMGDIYKYIYIIYTPNLGLKIAVFDREREQDRFKESTKGAKGRSGGARREHKGSTREQQAGKKA